MHHDCPVSENFNTDIVGKNYAININWQVKADGK